MMPIVPSIISSPGYAASQQSYSCTACAPGSYSAGGLVSSSNQYCFPCSIGTIDCKVESGFGVKWSGILHRNFFDFLTRLSFLVPFFAVNLDMDLILL